MRSIKKLSLAAAAVMAVMAFAGAGAASATTICSANNTGSPGAACSTGGWKYGTDINATDLLTGALRSGTTAVLTSPSGTVTCTGSNVTAGIRSDGTSGSISGLTFTGCDTKVGIFTFSCTVTVNSLPYPATASWLSNATNAINGRLSVTASAVNVNINCASGIVNCTVTASSNPAIDLFNPGNSAAPGSPTDTNAEGFANNIPLNGCGGAATWRAIYEITGENGSGAIHIQE
jgi:hypothetical protein